MTRCDYDVIFYRVFCITLLGIAFTFTVILTNVFVDIDGLLISEKVNEPTKSVQKTTARSLINLPSKDRQENAKATLNQMNGDLTPMYNYDKYNDESENNLDRSKRSVDAKTYKINVKSPKIKWLLSKQLSSLLEDLEEEESTTQGDTTISEGSFHSNNFNTAEKLKEIDKLEKKGVLHLALHNILLKGIIHHMDLNDIYSTINGLSRIEERNSENLVAKKNGLEQQLADAEVIENRFLEELANCTRLRKEIAKSSRNTVNINNSSIKNGAKIIINTVIDIKSVNDVPDKVKKKTNNENVIGIIKLLYNGKSVKFTDANDTPKNLTGDTVISTANTLKNTSNAQDLPGLFYKDNTDDYVSKFNKRESNIYPQLSEFLEKRRSKRNVELKNMDHHKKAHKNQSEFYVEIETKFDKKDMDISKKKQFIKDLIKTIQKAIGTKENQQKTSQKITHARPRHRIVQFKKRILSPLEDPLVKKLGVTAEHIIHRQLDPISKVVPMQENLGPDRIASDSKDAWKDFHEFPSFLSKAKSINSAEVGEVDVGYDKVKEGVPQRLQLPLNNNNINDVLDGQEIDVGDIKLSFKDLEGTGLAIGFNQYLPEADKFVVYDGLENIFEHFPENYGQDVKKGLSDDVNDEFANTMVSFHDIIKRSAPSGGHQDSSQDSGINSDSAQHKKYNFSLSSFLGIGVIEKPKKTLSVQKFFNHRHNIKVKKYFNTNAASNKHKKYVLRKVSNTNKRRKRDLSNIRILTDLLPGDVLASPDRSQENVFVVSDENIFDETPAETRRSKNEDKTTYDKTVGDQYDRLPNPDDFLYRNVKYQYHDGNRERVREIDSERERNREREPEQPLQQEREFENPQMYLRDQIREPERDSNPDITSYQIQGDLSKNDPILSNYPHIMADKGDENPIHNIIFDAQETVEHIEPKNSEIKPQIQHESVVIKRSENIEQSPDLEELTNAIAPKTSYKVTVKLLPKNDTNSDGTGVKEVFTTINKTFNKNGLVYSRLVNVSEIAKIQSLNETAPIAYLDANKKEQDQNHQNIILNNKLTKSENDLKELKQQRQILKDIINNNAVTKNIGLIPRRPDSFDLKKSDFLSIPTIPPSISDTTETSQTSTTRAYKPIAIYPPKLEAPKMETKMTNAILAKIEENTNALKTFLQRLNRLEESPKRQTFSTHNFMPQPTLHSLPQPFMMPTIPTHRNGSFIPFVYAFQHPMPSPNQTENNLSVLYHGHIHTKTGPKGKHFDVNKLNSQKHNKRNALRSRFFLDDVGTVIGTPMNVFKYKNYIKNPKIKINSTILI